MKHSPFKAALRRTLSGCGVILSTTVLIPLVIAAIAPVLTPFTASFPGDQRLDQPGGTLPVTAAAFAPFQGRLGLSWDKDFFFVEGNGLPDHNMMVGITAWQQQVPLPQAYVGENAWRVPLKPVVAAEPAMIDGRFLRGAIAIAVNGVPIFNPQNNRGEVSYEIGELDQWGGHCGRADDYHYHIAPVHLESVVGKGNPVAYALDGYPVLGVTEADGSAPENLDECHGHDHDGSGRAALGYHYHATDRYPYVFAGFHGEVVEVEGQVDPQPRAQPVREAMPGLRGAEITAFGKSGEGAYRLNFEVNGDKRDVRYRIGEDGTYPFEFDNGSEGVSSEIYSIRQGGGGGGGRPPRGGGPERRPLGGGGGGEKGMKGPRQAKVDAPRNAAAGEGFVLTSPEVGDGGRLPVDFTGDGEGATLPLVWSGAPAGTKSYALIMDHLAPDDEMKTYWVMWNIPPTVTSLAKNARRVGELGVGFRGGIGYEPPHSKGPGDKTYVLHVYALSAELDSIEGASKVNRETLLAAMEGKILATADLSVIYARTGESTGESPQKPKSPLTRF